MNSREENKMIYPCCKKELPAPLNGTAAVTCPCGQKYLPDVIIDYNEMVEILKGWRDAVNGKASIKAEPGEGLFIADLCQRGLKFCKD